MIRSKTNIIINIKNTLFSIFYFNLMLLSVPEYYCLWNKCKAGKSAGKCIVMNAFISV